MDASASKSGQESLDLVLHMSNLLKTGLDRQTLSILLTLCERGVNPEAIVIVVREIRRESATLSHQHQP